MQSSLTELRPVSSSHWCRQFLFTFFALSLSTCALAQFAGGDGSADNPWQIATPGQLDLVRNYLGEEHADKHFILTTNINLWEYADGEGWVPIGEATNRFTGSLDGDGYIIRNLTINRPGSDNQGLFGYLDGALITDLGVVNANVRGGSYTGALAGRGTGSVIEAVYVSGEVIGTGSYTGGLIGDKFSGNLHRVHAVVAVHASGSWTGGLVGRTDSSASIVHSYSLGSVQGASFTGGLIGYLSGFIADSYSRSSVSGTGSVGGLVGYMIGSASRIDRAYSTGAVTGTSNVGGFLGNWGAGTVADSYWDTETSGQETSARGTGRTTAEMQQRASYPNWNFNTLWSIDEGNAYPVFQDLGAYAGPQAVDLNDLAGDGSAGNPWIITNADELNAMRQDLGAHYRLGNDIDLAATLAWNGGQGWAPIGDTTNRFTGSLDGDGFVIRNLTINRPGSDNQGLFGYLDGALITNLGLDNAHVRGGSYTGALAGRGTGSVIEAVYVTGEVTGTGSYTGGLIGHLSGGSLHHGHAVVAVQASGSWTGGLLGRTASSASIAHSYSLGSVDGASNTGGLVGNLSGFIADSYSRSSVSGTGSVGGLVGYMIGSASRIDRAYSTGAVAGTSNVGGFLGNWGAGTVADSYWDTETSGQETSARGTGKTTEEMQQQATFSGWDFATVWSIVENLSYPNLEQTARAIALDLSVRTHANPASAGHQFNVLANTAWDAVENDNWIEVTQVTGGVVGEENGTVTYSIDTNPDPAFRIGTITVSDGAGITRVFTVRQGAVLETTPPYRNLAAIASTGHSIVISGNTAWTATSDSPWLVLKAGGSGNGDGTVTYRVAENTSLDPRSGTITVSGEGINRSHTVNQAGAAEYLAIAPDYREHAAVASSSHNITVSSNIDWSAATETDWINVTQGASGSGTGVITYSIDANPTASSRHGSIIVEGGKWTYWYRVAQAASSVSTYAISVGSIQGSGSVNVLTPLVDHGGDAEFEIAPDPGWSLRSFTGDTCTPIDNGDGTWTASEITEDCAVEAIFDLTDELIFSDRFEQE